MARTHLVSFVALFGSAEGKEGSSICPHPVSGEAERVGGVDKNSIYHKILNGYNWYTVLKIIPKEKLKEVLSEEVVKCLFPQPLRDKYRYVRSGLFE